MSNGKSYGNYNTRQLKYTKTQYETIHKVLLKYWAPIGIIDILEAHGRYQRYLPQLYGMLKRKADDEMLYNYLSDVEDGYMGLSNNYDTTCKMVSQLKRINI